MIMKMYTKLQCFFTVFLLWFVNLGYNAKTLSSLGLNEGDICLKGDVETRNSICREIKNCTEIVGIEKNNTVSQPICSYKGNVPIVCCPAKHFSATEMCEKYKDLIYFKKKNPLPMPGEDKYVTYTNCYIAALLTRNGEKAEPMEFPHMALLGFSEKPDNNSWFCGGSLISKRFVLTAAHCEQTVIEKEVKFANWARLGELDYSRDNDDANFTDYKIVQRIIHPKYRSTSHYHDIALFRLEKDVEFSAFVRPICLNTDTKLRPPTIIATGWGKGIDGKVNPHLSKVSINSISATECNNIFLDSPARNTTFTQGIVDSSMLCASSPKSGHDTCKGDSGGPIQIKHDKYECMYSQIGIISFGIHTCESSNSAGVYTRVSNYISWIEKNVWS